MCLIASRVYCVYINVILVLTPLLSFSLIKHVSLVAALSIFPLSGGASLRPQGTDYPFHSYEQYNMNKLV